MLSKIGRGTISLDSATTQSDLQHGVAVAGGALSSAMKRPAPAALTVPGWWPQLKASERTALLLVGDLAAMNGALLLALSIHRDGVWLDRLLPTWFLILSGVWFVAAHAFDCYNLKTASSPREGVLSASRAGLAAVLLYLAIPYVTPWLPSSRALMLLFMVAGLGLLAAWRGAYATLLSQQWSRTRALVIGAGPAGKTIVDSIRAHPSYEVLGYVDDETEAGGALGGLPVLGTSEQLMSIVRAREVQELILTIPDGMRPELHRVLVEAFESGVRVVPMYDVYESITMRIAVEHIGNSWCAALHALDGSGTLYDLCKRGLDIAFGLVGTAAFLLAYPVVAAAVRLDSPGPVLYLQDRVGRGGKLFQIAKFRSMVEDAEGNGAPVWAVRGDNRVTRVGRVLRATRLDELPQFLSILEGDMSLIGPRPERPAFVATLQEQIPFYRSRLLVRPGLTGWAQVMYRYGSTVEDALVKLQYDLYYIKHRSLYLDLITLFKTISVVLGGKGT